MSEQECVYSLLELPITQSSIKVEFINTSEIPNRVFIAKPDYLLKKMDPEDDNIKQPNCIDKYANRPKQLIDMCLADFVSMTDIVQNYEPFTSDDEQSMNILLMKKMKMTKMTTKIYFQLNYQIIEL